MEVRNHNGHSGDMIKVILINAASGGFEENLEVSDGATIEELISHLGLRNSTVLVNGNSVAKTYKLSADDRVSVTPNKVAGA